MKKTKLDNKKASLKKSIFLFPMVCIAILFILLLTSNFTNINAYSIKLEDVAKHGDDPQIDTALIPNNTDEEIKPQIDVQNPVKKPTDSTDPNSDDSSEVGNTDTNVDGRKIKT